MPSTLKITNIKANDGTTALTLDNSTGNVSATSELDVTTTIKVGGTTVLSKDSNNNVNLSPSVGTSIARGQFRKENPTEVLFTKTGAGTAQTQTNLYVEVNGTPMTIASGTTVDMPSTLTGGTDYAIWAETDGSLQASTSHTSAPSTGARKIGGFHYAPGGNATGTSGGNTTPQINEYSFWDLKFRPTCRDPRGMTLVAGTFWSDIYLCGVNHHTDGTSKLNVNIAYGSTAPKIPTMFGGNGTSVYSNANWWNMAEVMMSHGKRFPHYAEFAALAYGTTEQTQRPTDPVTTQMSTTDDNFTSKWGVIQATACYSVFGSDFGGGNQGASWLNLTGGRGQVYQFENVANFGGAWGGSVNYSGSRSSYWGFKPSDAGSGISARGVCNHLEID